MNYLRNNLVFRKTRIITIFMKIRRLFISVKTFNFLSKNLTILNG